MLQISSILGIIAGVLSGTSWILYTWGLLVKKTRPNRATWSILTFLGVLVFVTYYDGGARDTIWVTLAYVLGPLITALLSIFYFGEGGWTIFDRRCLVFVGICFFAWVVLRFYFPHIALPILIVSLCIDFIGLLPTIKKSWKNPQFENPPAWLCESLSSLVNLFAVTSWALTVDSFSIWIYPVYLFGVNALMAVFLFTGKYRTKR